MEKIKKIITSIQWSEISPAVVARYVLGLIAIINIILDKVGVVPITISESTVYSVCSIVFALIMIIINTYKNNSTSVEAMVADRVLDLIKASEKIDMKKPVLEQIEAVLKDIQSQFETDANADIMYEDDD